MKYLDKYTPKWSDLRGQTISNIELNPENVWGENDKLVIHFHDCEPVVITHEQECCEDVRLIDGGDEIQPLIGQQIVEINLRSGESVTEGDWVEEWLLLYQRRAKDAARLHKLLRKREKMKLTLKCTPATEQTLKAAVDRELARNKKAEHLIIEQWINRNDARPIDFPHYVWAWISAGILLTSPLSWLGTWGEIFIWYSAGIFPGLAWIAERNETINQQKVA
jgi:hypothetical protein